MTNQHKNSKNILNNLMEAMNCLRRQEGIVIVRKNKERMAVYPYECLDKSVQQNYQLTNLQALISLAKRAGILPALAVIPIGETTADWPVFFEKDIEESLIQTGGSIFEAARAKLPLAGAEDAVVVSFRAAGDEAVHLALLIGKERNNELPLVRVHSSCVTGDLLGSLRCDCGDQLQTALASIKAHGYGVLLYLNQEGRGIGITNKIRAYQLQEQGMDTYEANQALGFANDERDFAVAGSILKSLGISKIQLLSNNPHKVVELRKHGIIISRRVPLVIKAGKYNHAYLAAKVQKAGHIFNNDSDGNC